MAHYIEDKYTAADETVLSVCKCAWIKRPLPKPKIYLCGPSNAARKKYGVTAKLKLVEGE